MSHEKKMKDRVCGMIVTSDHYQVRYQGNTYLFCSEQCVERFSANPLLYVGTQWQPAPKQLGLTLPKRRRFLLLDEVNEKQAGNLRTQIGAMMGVEEIDVCGTEVTVSYDLLQATAAQIESTLVAAGASLDKGSAECSRRRFVHHTEEFEIGNLHAGTSAKGY